PTRAKPNASAENWDKLIIRSIPCRALSNLSQLRPLFVVGHSVGAQALCGCKNDVILSFF
ncbi:unnamed protein product, partial [Mycena citricolor]